MRFQIGLPSTIENKENTRPYVIRESDNDDQNDGPICYREDDADRAAKIARKESLSIKLALRPDRQELINRNILQLQSDNEKQESKEAIGARLIRRLSMRPTAEELVERNILKSEYSTMARSSRRQSITMIILSYSANSGGREETEGGEETLPAAKAQFPTHRGRVEGEEDHPVQRLHRGDTGARLRPTGG